MTGSVSTIGYGASNYSTYGMNGLGYNDPYFRQAYNSPNLNYQMMQQQAQVQTQAQAQAQVQPQASPSFHGAAHAIEQEQPEKKSGIGKWITGLAAIAGTIWAGYKCFKKGDGTGLAKIFDGAKKYASSAWNCVRGWFGKSKQVEAPTTTTALPRTTAQLALPPANLRTINASGYEITLQNDKMVRCVKDGVEYTASQLPENFELLIKRALKNAA